MTARLCGISLNVANIDRSLAFYQGLLGFRAGAIEQADPAWAGLIGGPGSRARRATIFLGKQAVELLELEPLAAAYPADGTASDLWFQHFAIVTNDLAAIWLKLRDAGATPITLEGPQRLPPTAGGVFAYKFKDPDGHPLELIHFPSNVGDPAWQAAGATLGIDHSAISVADTKRSLAFYTGLGLMPGARQINKGVQQDRLDGLAEVVVEVVALAAPAAPTPHVELLCYRAPRGRPRSEVVDPCRNIADTRLVFCVDRIEALASLKADVGPVRLASKALASLVRDPDGHAIVLIESPRGASTNPCRTP